MPKKSILSLQDYKNKQFHPTNWLSKIEDDRSLTELSIPATHDSAAYSSPDMLNKFTQFLWKTQILSIQEQLTHGVRFFDFKIRCEQNQPIKLFRGETYLGLFKNVASIIQKFLSENASEFVIMMFEKDQGSLNPVISGKKVFQQIKSMNEKQECNIYMNSDIPFDQHMPTVGELRGKILVLEAYVGMTTEIQKKLSLSGCMKIPVYGNKKVLTDSLTHCVQNFWEGPVDDKKKQIANLIRNKEINLLKFNYLTEASYPKTNSIKYNIWFKEFLARESPKKFGIILMDFPEQTLIDQIIQSNFERNSSF